MPIGIAWLVRREGSMREAMVTTVHIAVHIAVHVAVHLSLEAVLQTRSSGCRVCSFVLHSKHMRRQTEAVPRVLR